MLALQYCCKVGVSEFLVSSFGIKFFYISLKICFPFLVVVFI